MGLFDFLGGGNKGGEVQVTEYRMSIHYGICQSPVDYISQIKIDKKVAWRGQQSVQGPIDINKPELFGGIKKQGGVAGRINYLPGLLSQLVPGELAERVGRVQERMPSYRGIVTAWMHELLGAARNGFMWGANNPYIPDTEYRVHYAPQSLPAGTSKILRPETNAAWPLDFDANPIHVIYDVLTSTTFPNPIPPSLVDYANFSAVAQVIYDEAFGVSFQIMEDMQRNDFLSEVLGHIDAHLFINPRTGLITIKLIRGDYDASALTVFSPDNCVITKFSKGTFANTINEILITYTRPRFETPNTLPFQDEENISIQGRVVRDEKNYHGIHSRSLAVKVGWRDLRVASSPRATGELMALRHAWDLNVADVFSLYSPEDGVEQMACRVLSVDRGKIGDPYVKVTFIEDIFGRDQTTYFEFDDTLSEDLDDEPVPAEFTYAFTLPWYLIQYQTGATSIIYPETMAGVLATQAGSAFEFELYGEKTDPTGATTITSVGTKTMTARGLTSLALVAEATSTILPFATVSSGPSPQVGGFLIIGEGTDQASELVLVTSIGVGGFTVKRGVLDTVPKAWPIATPVWVLNSDLIYVDQNVRADANVVHYQVLPRTSLGLLDLGDAPVITRTLTGRPNYPSRPANVQINGVGFGTVNAIGLSTVSVTWAERNKTTETGVVLGWTDASVAPEVGQTTTVTLTDAGGTVIVTHGGLTGTSYALATSDFGSINDGYVVVSAERDGRTSLQAHKIRILVNSNALLFEDGAPVLLEDGSNLLLE
jgi:hypothetical protein